MWRSGRRPVVPATSQVETAAHRVGGRPVAVLALIVFRACSNPLEAVDEVELLRRLVVDGDFEEHLARPDRPRPFHAGAKQVAGHTTAPVARSDANGEQL